MHGSDRGIRSIARCDRCGRRDGRRGTGTTTPSTEPAVSVAGGADQPGEPLEIGLAPLLLTAPAVTDAGERPAFAWEPIADAVSYALAVLTDIGEPLWAWQGQATTVVLGGWSEVPPPEAPGPLLPRASRWFVVALDADGQAIANSVLRPVAP